MPQTPTDPWKNLIGGMHDALQTYLGEILTHGVEAGVITQAQADALALLAEEEG